MSPLFSWKSSIVLKFSILLLIFLASVLRVRNNSSSPPAHIHPPIFEEEHYEIKSCLSPELEAHEKTSCRFYAMVIDAGSTGTRIHIFEFSHDNKRPASPFKLEKEHFEEVKPGLSAFGKDAAGAAGSVERLLVKAEKTVPKHLWSHTPLTLKATAGLRLMPLGDAEAILVAVEELFKNSPFILGDDPASIMSGTDEGIFGWFTLNFLLNRIDAVLLKPEDLLKAVAENLTAAALDLGGGSTQVTFRPLKDLTFEEAPAGYLKEIRIFGKDVTLYSHSYLGNGLLAMRLGMLKLNSRAKAETLKLFTNCMPREFSMQWNYNGSIFTVRGTKSYGYLSCYWDVRRYVDFSQIDSPPELPGREIYAFGYFFDRALQAGLVRDETNGGRVRVLDFKLAAEKACKQMEFGEHHWHPWQCLDLTYIYSFLTDGYGLPDEKEIEISKKLQGMETSWALGAAYHLLNTYHERTLQALGNVEGYGRRLATDTCYYFCSRLYYGLTNLMSYFQLLA